MSPSKRDAALILATFAIAGILFLSPSYIRPDSVAVMSWLRSAAMDGDLLFFDEWAGFGMIGDGFAWFKEVTTVGALANHWWVGTSVLCAPFWGVSHLVSLALPSPLFPDDGFFGLDLATLGWTSVLFGALASLAALAMIRETDPDSRGRDVAFSLALACVGTPMFWYVFRTPIGTHAAGMMLVGAIACLCWRLVSRPEEGSPLLLGLLFGLATVTRLQHVVLLPAIVFAGVRSRRSTRFYTAFAAGAAVPVAVQAIAWHAIYGTPLGPLVSGANLEGVTWMPFRTLQLVPVLFSSWHGLLSWSPIVLVSLTGWLVLYRDGAARRDLAIVFGLMFAGELVANAALDRYWWGGMSFGARRFVDLAAPFAVGIAAAVRSRARVPAMMASVGAAAWSIGLMLAAAGGSLSLSRYVSAGDLLLAVSAFPESLSSSQLRSPVTNGTLFAQSIVAMLVIAAIALVVGTLTRNSATSPARMLLALNGVALVAAVLLLPPTRTRAALELARHGLTGEAARSAGALLDQRGLIEDEAAWLRARGDLARLESVQHEIDAITGRLRELGIDR
ncbi:MAG: hypothetical protein NDJ92_08920 [Thermoanaerobaculia bacterium]|nr:hypothetical protein [Thermoanaerobaculia bacterium]